MRKIAQSDYIASGQAPVFLRIAKEGKRSKEAPLSDEEFMQTFEAMIGLTKAKLTRCCGSISTKEGDRFKIVDKLIDDLTENEISIEELNQADADAICAAIDELSGLKKEAVEAAQTFPEGQADGSGSAPNIVQLRSPSEPIARIESA